MSSPVEVVILGVVEVTEGITKVLTTGWCLKKGNVNFPIKSTFQSNQVSINLKIIKQIIPINFTKKIGVRLTWKIIETQCSNSVLKPGLDLDNFVTNVFLFK